MFPKYILTVQELCTMFVLGVICYTHRFNEVEKVVYWFHLVRPPVCRSGCGQNHVRSVSSTILTGSIWYLYIFGILFKFATLTLSYFDWDPIWINNMDNHGAAGLFSECMRSCCSSCALLLVAVTHTPVLPHRHWDCPNAKKPSWWIWVNWYRKSAVNRWCHYNKRKYDKTGSKEVQMDSGPFY